MPRYYTVTWVDDKGVEHKTSSSDPNRLQSKIQENYGGSSRVTRVDYSDARGIPGSSVYEGPVYEEKPVVSQAEYVPPFVKEAYGVTPLMEESFYNKPFSVVPVSAPYKPVGPDAPFGYSSVQRGYNEQLGVVRGNIQLVESSPSGTMFSTDSGEQIDRDKALFLLRQQESDIVSRKQQLRSYQHQDYVISRDEQGNLVFTKQEGVVLPEKYEPSVGGFLSFLTTGFTPTFGLSGPISPEENIKRFQQELMYIEQQRKEMISRGDWLGVGTSVITSPVPMTLATMGLGFGTTFFAGTRFGSQIFGSITLPKILGARTITATPASTVSSALGGVFVGAGAGGVVKTLNEFGVEAARQSVLVSAVTAPMYMTSFNIGKGFYQNLPKELVGRVFKYHVPGTQLEVLGEQKYIDVFGKRYHVGRYEPFAGRIGRSYTGLEIVDRTVGFEPIKSISQMRGLQMITYDVVTGKFIKSSAPPIVGMKPLSDSFFKPPANIVKPVGDIVSSYKTPVVDLFKKFELKAVQTKFEDFKWKGSFLIETSDVIEKEKTPVYIGTKPFISKSVVDVGKPAVTDKLKWTDIDQKKVDLINKNYMAHMEKWHGKIFTLKDIVSSGKPVFVQKKLFEEPLPSFKPLYGVEFKPPEKKVMTMEDIFGKISESSKKQFLRTPVIKLKQTYLDIFFMPSVDVIVAATKPFITKSSKPFDFLKVKPSKSVEKTQGVSGPVVLEEIVKEEKIVYPFEPDSVNPFRKYKSNLIYDEYGVSSYWMPISPFGKTKVSTFIISGGKPFLGEQKKSVEDVLSQKQVLETGLMFSSELQRMDIGLNVDTSRFTHQMLGNIVLTEQTQINKQKVSQMQRSELSQLYIQELGLKNIGKMENKGIETFKLKLFDVSDEFLEKAFGGARSYQVWVRPRQYIGGKRIGDGKPYPFSSRTFSRDDAMAVGADKVDNSSKATFFIKPSDKKPSRRPGGVKPWSNFMFEYIEKEDGRFVESSRFRIDTIGEIREISRLGWLSHKKRHRRFG